MVKSSILFYKFIYLFASSPVLFLVVSFGNVQQTKKEIKRR